MILFIYRTLYFPLKFILKIFYFTIKETKLGQTIELKNKLSIRGDFHIKHPIWIHAASGEIEYARPIIRQIRKQFPHEKILLTYSSPSAIKIISQIPEINASTSIPWDTAQDCSYFLDQFQPKIALFARTDVWPEMAYQLRKRNIPSLLFSATFAAGSSRIKFPGKYFLSLALKNLTAIHCVSIEDQKNISELVDDSKISVHGDTRFDQVFHRLNHPRPIRNLLFQKSDSLTVVLGSTWPEDEIILLPAIAKLPNTRFILAPHEVGANHLQSIEGYLQRLNISFQYYSKSQQWTSQVLIIDQVGILAELYAYGNIAFVGGSFKGQVHSVMEPLAAGLPVTLGPFYHNNREAILFMDKHQLVFCIHNTNEFTEIVQKLQNKNQSHPEKVQELVRKYCGASNSVLDWMTSHL